MARESQGLQILLIVFVMLSVVLGVSLYLYVKKADEATKAAVAADGREKQALKDTADKQKECDLLKTMIGYPELSADKIKEQFDKDMDTYFSGKRLEPEGEMALSPKPHFEASTLFYSRLLAGMYKTIQDRSDELIKSTARVAALETEFKNREATSAKTIEGYDAKYQDLTAQAKKIADEYTSGVTRTTEETSRMSRQVAEIKSRSAKAEADALAAETRARKAVEAKEKEVRELTHIVNTVDRPDMDVPSGEITWVSLPNKTVWINRGRADALQRQTKFTVYAADSNMGAKAVKKGTVEVVKIEGDHSAQARILDDKLSDPIMAGDKVFTPLWSPGQQNHFALAGVMNLDGDGRNQLSVVKGMINQNGGEVDCWLDEHGDKQGRITTSTRFIVMGDPPDKGTAKFKTNNGAIVSEAERYQVRKMTLSDFKQQMDYHKTSSVEHFGPGAASSGGGGGAPSVPKAGGGSKAASTTTDDFGK